MDEQGRKKDRENRISGEYTDQTAIDVAKGRNSGEGAKPQGRRGGNGANEAKRTDPSDGDSVLKRVDENDDGKRQGQDVSQRVGEESDRLGRYVESEDMSSFARSGNVNNIKPYFDGDSLNRRMADIRKGIEHIRNNWHQYDDFNNLLRDYAEENVKTATAKSLIDSILSTKKEWADIPKDVIGDSFHAIRLYTSVKGYEEIFSLINSVFRDESATSDTAIVTTAVFLVELINIDLFNYCLLNRRFSNFTGVVYRGMALQKGDYDAFQEIRNQPIANRYIATPLGLVSTSSSLDVANKFIARVLKIHKDRSPLLMKIHIIELEPEYLRFYRERFPISVVSTICAVDIKDLSVMPHEKEVLLRGPFFQVLDFYDGETIEGKTCKVLEMVALNANRDHISTMRLGDSSAPARELFGNMVAATRCKFAAEFCSDRGLIEDARAYREMLNEKMSKLKTLMDG